MAISTRQTATSEAVVDTGNSKAQALFDLLVAGSCLLCLAPIMVLAAAAVFLESGRPIFFSQMRLGRHGKPFRLYKFRKFYDRPGAAGGALTIKNDPRLSRVGRVLERTKLDELPQLWNVLRRDMSVVGPRPESLHFADCFEQYRRVLDHRPGIFGPAQAMSRNEGALHQASSDPEAFYRTVLFPTKARIDLAYYPTRTVLGDTGWIILCVLAIFGWSSIPHLGRNTVQEMEDWVQWRPAVAGARPVLQARNLAPGE